MALSERSRLLPHGNDEGCVRKVFGCRRSQIGMFAVVMLLSTGAILSVLTPSMTPAYQMSPMGSIPKGATTDPEQQQQQPANNPAATEQHLTIDPFPVAEHPLKPLNLALNDGQKGSAVPTNAWWENLVLEGNQPVSTSPYAVKAFGGKFQIAYPPRLIATTDDSVVGGYAPDVTLTAGSDPVASSLQPFVTSYDALSVEVSYLPKESTDDAPGMVLPLVRGSPLLSAEFTMAAPTLSFLVPIRALEIPEGPSSDHGSTVYQVSLTNGQNWLIYTRPALQLEWSNTTVLQMAPSGQKFTGVLRVGYLSCGTPSASWLKKSMPCNDAAFDKLLPHLHRYPVGGSVEYQVLPGRGSEEKDAVDFKYLWKTRGVGESMVHLYLPHHMMMMEKEQVLALRNSALSINSWQSMMMPYTVKGPMTPAVLSAGKDGSLESQFRLDLLELNFHSNISRAYTEARPAIKWALQQDVARPIGSLNDTYHLGKKLARLAKLALIAKELGQTEEIDQLLSTVSKIMSNWLSGNTPSNALVYDKTWGGLVVQHGLKYPNEDYGNGYYNDHHFHYGYMIYTMAVWYYLDPKSASKALGGNLGLYAGALVNDIANGDPNLKEFPVARHFDFFEGHSWASGLFKMPDGREQESTSEAVNAYYGVTLLGQVLNDRSMADFGRVLCTLEILSARSYWHIPGPVMQNYFPVFPDGLYPPQFNKNAMVGVVASTRAAHSTWFGTNVEYVHGIQMIPFTPASEYLLPKQFMLREYGQVAMSLIRKKPVVENSWAGYIRMAEGIIDPAGAWAGVQTLSASEFDDGNSMTAALHWVATRPLNAPSDAKKIFSQ